MTTEFITAVGGFTDNPETNYYRSPAGELQGSDEFSAGVLFFVEPAVVIEDTTPKMLFANSAGGGGGWSIAFTRGVVTTPPEVLVISASVLTTGGPLGVAATLVNAYVGVPLLVQLTLGSQELGPVQRLALFINGLRVDETTTGDAYVPPGDGGPATLGGDRASFPGMYANIMGAFYQQGPLFDGQVDVRPEIWASTLYQSCRSARDMARPFDANPTIDLTNRWSAKQQLNGAGQPIITVASPGTATGPIRGVAGAPIWRPSAGAISLTRDITGGSLPIVRGYKNLDWNASVFAQQAPPPP